MRRVNLDQLKTLAKSGEELRNIAAALNVHANTIKRTLRKQGLYDSWSEMRWA